MAIILPTITVWQPWASLIAIGAKPYEFRGWPAPPKHQGKRIGIHAGARPVKRDEIQDLLVRLRSPQAWTTCLKPELAIPLLEKALTSPGCLLRSHMLCSGVLGKPIRGHEIVGEFGGTINDSDRDAHANFAWPLTEIEAFEPPLPAKGAQGFWNFEGI